MRVQVRRARLAAVVIAREAALVEVRLQRDHLEREAYHRAGNNLQMIISLLNLQYRALSNPDARAAISETRQRISAMALINRAVFNGPSLTHVDLRQFIESLLDELTANDAIDGPRFEVELEIDLLAIDRDELAPLALFALEAIINARKHGLGRFGGRLRVNLSSLGALSTLSIADSGKGDGAVAAMTGKGVGQLLMRALARQLRGRVAFDPNPEGGLTTSLAFPAGNPR